MPFNLTAVPAALVEEGQDVLIGDIRVLAGTRVAFIDGLTQGVFDDAPAGTLFGNLFTESGPMRPFGMDRFIGAGLQYTTDLANGPFPETVAEDAQSFPASSTTMQVTLPVPKLYDRYIIVTQHNGVNSITTPAGWTLKSHAGLSDSDHNAYERIVDQAFIDSGEFFVTFVASVAGASLAKVWMVRYAHISLTCEILAQTNTSTGGTTNDIGTLTPSWVQANTLWLTAIGIEADDPSPPNVTAFPTGFTDTGELQNVSGTASLDGAIAWGQLSSRTTAVNPTAYTYAASRSAAILIAIPPRVTGAISVVPGGGTAGWDDVLAVDPHSGNNNPIVDDINYLQFGIAAPPVSGQIRTSEPWEARGQNNMDITAGEDINLIAFDSSQFRVTAGALSLRAFDGLTLTSDGSFINANASTSMTLTSGTNMTLTPSGHLFIGSISLTDDMAFNCVGVIDINSGTDVINLSGNTGINATTVTGSITLTSPFVFLPTGFLKFTEVAASTPSMSAGQGLFWVKNDTPNNPFFTDDTNTDRQIATFPIPLSGFATIATDTFLGNVSGGTAAPTAVNLSTLAGAGLVFGTHTLDVTAGAGGSIVVTANDVQRGALTGAVTASQDSNTTAFGALAAKSVLANATNASAVPSALAGSAAFQHLRVNSANTGLEWSVFTSGDFPAGVVPVTALATIATDTFLANVTAGTATPTAVNLSTLAGAGLVFGTHTLDVTAGAGGSIVVTANDVQRGALTGVITAAQDSNTTAFATVANDTFLANVSGGVAAPSATNLSTLAGAGLVFGTHTLDVTAGAGGSLVVGANDIQRAALTGAITASQDSNTTAFGALAAKSVLANATNASAVPAALAGSAAFQHLRVNSANTGLEWSVFTTGDFPAASVPITALATIATDTFLANVTAGTATPTAVNLSTLAGAGLVFGTHTLDVTAGAGGSLVVSANDIQRAALTGAITATQDSNTTAFGALAAKSVLANATNASAVPSALAGSAAFQHLRVNSGNTGLEWSVFTSGDFPAGVVPLTAHATQAANTIVANATAGVASPTAVTVGAESVFGQTSGNLQGIASAVQTALIRGSGSVFWASAAADQVLRRSGSGDLGFGTLVTNNIGVNQVALDRLAQVATPRLLGRTTAATGNVEALTVSNGNALTWDTAVGGDISIDYVGSTSNVNSATTAGDLNVFDISTLLCGGTVTLQALSIANIDGFTAKTDGFWFILHIRDATTAEYVTLTENNGNTTTSIRTPAARGHRMTKNDTVMLIYSLTRWRVVETLPKLWQISADDITWAAQQDDYARGGRADSYVRVTLTGGQFLTGVVPDGQAEGFPGGELMTIQNIDTIDSITVSHEGTASATAVNRFTLPNNERLQIPPGQAASFRHDGTSSRWRLHSSTFDAQSTYLGIPQNPTEWVEFIDETFGYLVTNAGTTTAAADVFVGITNGAKSNWIVFSNVARGQYQSATLAGHVGLVQLQTGTTANDYVALGLTADKTSANSTVLPSTGIRAIDFWCSPTSTLTNLEMIVGYGSDISVTEFGTVSCIFRFNPTTNANWQCITRNASTDTTTTTTVAGAVNTIKRFTIWRNQESTEVRFYIDGIQVALHTTNITTALVLPGVRIQTTNTTAKFLNLDRIKIIAHVAAMVQ